MDYANRTEAEARLARAIGRLSASQRRKLLKLMGNPPKLENLPPQYWDGHFTEWMGTLSPELERIFVDSAMALVESDPQIVLTVEWGVVNQTAADWARQYAPPLVNGITETTQRGVQNAVTDYFDQGLTMGQLREKLGRYFGPERAVTIARTEVTRAAVEGEREVVRELSASTGIEMVEVWQTKNDELVCPICGPRHNKAKGDGWNDGDGPPAHPRCRCSTNHFIRELWEGEMGGRVS